MGTRMAEINAETVRDLAPDDLREIQADTHHRTKDANLWVTDVPVCLNCQSGNPCAYGGAKIVTRIDGVGLVAETCHDCEQTTVQVLDIREQDD